MQKRSIKAQSKTDNCAPESVSEVAATADCRSAVRRSRARPAARHRSSLRHPVHRRGTARAPSRRSSGRHPAATAVTMPRARAVQMRKQGLRRRRRHALCRRNAHGRGSTLLQSRSRRWVLCSASASSSRSRQARWTTRVCCTFVQCSAAHHIQCFTLGHHQSPGLVCF
jgi:hypothetical protein